DELHNESFGDPTTRDVAHAQEFQFTRFNFIFLLNFNSTNTELHNLKINPSVSTIEIICLNPPRRWIAIFRECASVNGHVVMK
ncbi:hypothetical protein HAX54_047682, partial [Datura stramonium]|nr:hypothetical protein [Datura stramonium]